MCTQPLFQLKNVCNIEEELKKSLNKSSYYFFYLQRKDYTALKKYLGEKFEYIVKIRTNDLQEKLYREYLNKVVENRRLEKVCLFLTTCIEKLFISI